MATDYISPWGGMPTGGQAAWGFSEVPDYVKQHFQNYMTSGGHNIGFQDPNNPNLMWQAMNTLPGGEGEPGNMYGGYRVYQPSWDGGFNWEPGSEGTSYDLFREDGSYGGSEGFNKPSAQRTFNQGLALVATMGALSAAGALGGTAGSGAAGGTAAGEVGAGAAGTGAVSSPVVGGGAGAVTTTPLLPASAGGGLASSMPAWLNAANVGKAVSLGGGLLSASGSGSGSGGGSGGGGGLDPRLGDVVYGDMAPRAQGLLGQQMGPANTAGADMMQRGSGLLNGTPLTGNGFGQVQMDTPTTPQNPYLMGLADDMQRRTQDLLSQNNNVIAGRQISAGGLGGTRAGVAQGVAAGQAADSLQGQLAGLYGNAWNADANRALQKYQTDTGFYQGQRGQDLQSIGLGGDLMGAGLNTQWTPLMNTAKTMQPFTNSGGSVQPSDSKWQNAISTGLGIYGAGKNFSWW